MRNKVHYVDSFLHFSIFFLSYTKNIYIFRLFIFFLSIFHTLSITFVSRQKCWCVLQDLVTMQDRFLSNQTFATRYNSHKKRKAIEVFPLLLGTNLIFINKQQKQRILRSATHYKVLKTTKREITLVEYDTYDKWGNYCACTLQTVSTHCCVKLCGIYAK